MRATLPSLRFRYGALLALLLFWPSRIWRIDALPLHVDEGIHLRTALKVFEGDLLWHVSNGKIIGHWPIALLLPQNQPVFVARMATVLLVMLGFAAGYALVRRLFGPRAAGLAALLWIASPFQFFFERTALMDAQTGALVVLALWVGLLALQHKRAWIAVLTGLILLTAILYKLTAAPAVATLGFVLLFYGQYPLRQRIRTLLIIGATLAICVVIPLPFILPRLLASSGGASLGSFSPGFDLAQITANLQAFIDALTGFGDLTWALLIVGLLLLLLRRGKEGLVLILAPLPLLAAIIVLSSEVYMRYFAVLLPLYLIIGGAGLGTFLDALRQRLWRWVTTAILAGLLLLGFVPFALTAYSHPGDLTLPQFMRWQYLTEHSSGFGLREAMLDLPHTITRRDLTIVGSMFADSCRRSNYYAPAGFTLVCGDNLGHEAVENALNQTGAVYVLSDRPPYTGIDVSHIAGRATKLAVYPRPGEDDSSASITLWLIERPG